MRLRALEAYIHTSKLDQVQKKAIGAIGVRNTLYVIITPAVV